MEFARNNGVFGKSNGATVIFVTWRDN